MPEINLILTDTFVPCQSFYRKTLMAVIKLRSGDKNMSVSKKIKQYREMRGLSQKMLGELCGINESTIRKYELGLRNPKPDQLIKIADALCVSVNLFMDIKVETDSDVISLILSLDEQVDLEFIGEKDENNRIIPETLALRFTHPSINERLAKWADVKALLQKNYDSIPKGISEEEHEAIMKDWKEKFDDAKKFLTDSNLVVTKGTKGEVYKLRNSD